MSAQRNGARERSTKHEVRKRRRRGRRRFLAWIGVGTAGVAILGQRLRAWGGRTDEGVRVVVTPACVGCTACAIACPTDAIHVTPGGIHVVQEDCISCGYCQAGCSVDGIRVVKEAPRG